MKNIQVLLKLLLLLTVLQFVVTPAYAGNDFFEQRYRGWLWFDEAVQEQSKLDQGEQAEQELQNPLPTKEDMLAAKAENEKFAEELELLRHLTIRHPDNLEYIKLYKLKEKKMMDDAQTLGINWLMVNFLHPEIIDELENPQNIYGRDIRGSEEQRSEKLALHNVASKVELFVFRKDGCPYCSTLEKHLKTFASKYGFTVEAVSPDGSTSKYFETHSAPELISALGLEVMPTVIAVVKDTRQRFELARGAVSIVDLEAKALLLAKHLGISQQNTINDSEFNKALGGESCSK